MDTPLSDKHKREQNDLDTELSSMGQPIIDQTVKVDSDLHDEISNEKRLDSNSTNNSTQLNTDSTISNNTIPTSTTSHDPVVYQGHAAWRKFIYDVIVFIFHNVFNCFFREIKTRGGFKIPKDGPVIFVGAPHANQFVDPVILMDQVKKCANRRVSFLIAELSLKRLVVGFLARCLLTIGVVRPQDNLSWAKGKIYIDSSNPRKIWGIGTCFTKDMEPKGLIGLPNFMGSSQIESIESDNELTLRKEFKLRKSANNSFMESLYNGGTKFKYAHPVNQSKVYEQVFEHLARDNCIGIFPEGGSHDRTDLLPLKAGVAIMALGCMSKYPNKNVKIVPCGMNYFHPHKFRSRAVIEFGDPIEISQDLVEKYNNPTTNKDAVKELLDNITDGLKSVTVTCNDYNTLMVVQTIRRLYSTQYADKLPLPLIVDLNRKLVQAYNQNKDDIKGQDLTRDILQYNANLKNLNIPDHLVESTKFNPLKNLIKLVINIVKITILLILSMPGIIMFSPVFFITKRISERKAREALAHSTVKIKANDVIATWKILIALGVAPLLYIFWSILLMFEFSQITQYSKTINFVIVYIICVIITYSALIVGDIGMDIFKSIKPLYISLISPDGLKNLQDERRLLTIKIVDFVNQLGNNDLVSSLNEGESNHSSMVELLFRDGKDKSKTRTSGLKRKSTNLKRRNIVSQEDNDNNDTDVTKIDESTMSNSVLKDDTENENESTHVESDAVSLINSDNSLSNIPIFSTTKGSDSNLFHNVSSGAESEFEIDDAETHAHLEVEDTVDTREDETDNVKSRIAQAVRQNRG